MAYQPSSRLEITLHALMPTPVQLSTVGQPFIQGDHRLHVIEVPFWLRGAHRKATPLRHVSQIHNSQLLSWRATLAIFQTLVYTLHLIHLTDLYAYVHLQGDIYMPLKTFVHILLFMPQLDYRWSTKFIIAHISC